MTFHPEALDTAQLKRLAKQMSRGSAAVLKDTSLTLSQSQELLARALGHENWHAAQQGRRTASKQGNASPATEPGAWQGMDRLVVHERLLLGAFISAADGQHAVALRMLKAATDGFDRGDVGLEALPISLENYSDDIATALRLAQENASHALAQADPTLTVDQVLRRALEHARQHRPLPVAWFWWLKSVNPGLWKSLDFRKEAAASGDPFEDLQARLMLFEDAHTLLEAGISLEDAFQRIAQAYHKHGLEDRAAALDKEWVPGIASGESWHGFLVAKLSSYDRRDAVRFDLVRQASSGSEAMRQLVGNLEKQVEQRDRKRQQAAGGVVVNNLAPGTGLTSPMGAG